MARKRKNFTISDKADKELSAIPPGQKSQFVENAILSETAKLKRQKFLKNYLKSKKPIWTEENHPDLLTIEDFASYRPLIWRTKAS